MATTIKLKNSVTTTSVPSSLVQGEVAINITDKKVWVGNAATTPIQIAGAGTTGNAAGSNTQVQYNSSGSFAGDADFTFNGTTVTMANDASISGLTVGKGGGSQSLNTALGYQSLNNASNGNNGQVGVGYQALYSNTTGSGIAVGYRSLYVNTSGSNNTAIGESTLTANTTGGRNVGIGDLALTANTTASQNTAVGYQAAYSNTTGQYNTALGYGALFTNSTGQYNTAIGRTALNLATGSLNTAIGYGSGEAITTGAKNTIIGGYTGNQGGLDIRTASNYIVLSDGDGNPRFYIDNNGNSVVNGGYLQLPLNQTMRIPSTGGISYVGNINSATVFQIAYNSTSAGVQLSSGATSWGTFSDSRLKNITGTYTNALNDIAQIKPVKFTWKADEDSKPQVGVIAQSIQNVVPEAVDSTTIEMDGTEKYLTVRYTELIPLMIASIQELKAEVDLLKAQLNK